MINTQWGLLINGSWGVFYLRMNGKPPLPPFKRPLPQHYSSDELTAPDPTRKVDTSKERKKYDIDDTPSISTIRRSDPPPPPAYRYNNNNNNSNYNNNRYRRNDDYHRRRRSRSRSRDRRDVRHSSSNNTWKSRSPPPPPPPQPVKPIAPPPPSKPQPQPVVSQPVSTVVKPVAATTTTTITPTVMAIPPPQTAITVSSTQHKRRRPSKHRRRRHRRHSRSRSPSSSTSSSSNSSSDTTSSSSDSEATTTDGESEKKKPKSKPPSSSFGSVGTRNEDWKVLQTRLDRCASAVVLLLHDLVQENQTSALNEFLCSYIKTTPTWAVNPRIQEFTRRIHSSPKFRYIVGVPVFVQSCVYTREQLKAKVQEWITGLGVWKTTPSVELYLFDVDVPTPTLESVREQMFISAWHSSSSSLFRSTDGCDAKAPVDQHKGYAVAWFTAGLQKENNSHAFHRDRLLSKLASNAQNYLLSISYSLLESDDPILSCPTLSLLRSL